MFKMTNFNMTMTNNFSDNQNDRGDDIRESIEELLKTIKAIYCSCLEFFLFRFIGGDVLFKYHNARKTLYYVFIYFYDYTQIKMGSCKLSFRFIVERWRTCKHPP